MLSRGITFPRALTRLASSQSSLSVLNKGPGADVIETSSGVKACLMESQVSQTDLSQHLKKDIADVNVVVKAGTRYESALNHQLGAAQGLKIFSLLSHQGSTIVRSVGTIESMGCEFGITVTREMMIYKLSCEQKHLDKVMPFITAALSEPEYRKWELSKAKYQAKLDSFLFSQDPVAVTIDLLHSISFRSGGLGNSLSMTEEQIDAMSGEKLLEYHKQRFSSDNTFVVSNNAARDVIESQFEKFGTTSSGSHVTSHSKSEFVSDEIRSDDNTKNSVVVALASKSGPTNSKKAIVNSVLAHLLQGKSSQHAIGQTDFLGLGLDESKDEWAKAFHCDYSDAGLFGILLHSTSESAGDHIKGLMESLKKLESSLGEEHLATAKSSYLRGMITHLSTPAAQIEHVATLMLSATAVSHDDFNSVLASITVQDLKKALRDFVSGPKSMAAHGNCTTVPYLDQI